MSALQELTDRIRDDVVARYSLTEIGAPYEVLSLADTGQAVGVVRVWTGAQIPKLVDSRLTIADLGIDSVMLHAFAASDSAIPHLGSDVAGIEGKLNFTIDVVPRVDLAVEPAYLDEVYLPLTVPRAQAYAIEGAEPIVLPLRLLAFSSPWIASVTVSEAHVDDIAKVFDAYLHRFYALIDDGVPAVADIDLVARDRAHRRAQFDPASDEVWGFLAELVGQTSIDTILDLVRAPGPPTPR